MGDHGGSRRKVVQMNLGGQKPQELSVSDTSCARLVLCCHPGRVEGLPVNHRNCLNETHAYFSDAYQSPLL